MKAFLAFLLVPLFQARAFDEAAFGQSLNGWTRDGSARYSLAGAVYRTTRPLETTDADGNLTVAVTVLHRANSWAEVPMELEVTFAPDGSAQACRIHGTPRGRKVDTGSISRPGSTEDGSDPVAAMKQQLFESLDPQLVAAASAGDTRKRDLLARIYGPEPVDPAAISAGLRYNLDRILGLTRQAAK